MPLRIPTTLAVAIAFAGCDRDDSARVAVDARRDTLAIDARRADAGAPDTEQVAPPDARADGLPDAPIDVPPDAAMVVDAPPDAAVDAYVAVDAAADAPHV